jgi:hypothetical protein
MSLIVLPLCLLDYLNALGDDHAVIGADRQNRKRMLAIIRGNTAGIVDGGGLFEGFDQFFHFAISNLEGDYRPARSLWHI